MQIIFLPTRGQGRILSSDEIPSVVKHDVGQQKDIGKVYGDGGIATDVLKHKDYIIQRKLTKLFPGCP